MAFKHKRVRVEQGCTRTGDIYWACATAPGDRKAQWKKLGAVGIQEARASAQVRLQAQDRGDPADSEADRTVRDLEPNGSTRLDELEATDELRPRTVASYKGGIMLPPPAAMGKP